MKHFLREWCLEDQDGQKVFTAALNRYQALDQFEQILEKLLLCKLNERFTSASTTSGSEHAPTWTEGSPFRGLEAFQFVHAPVFCGRTHAIGEVLDRLRSKATQGRPFVLILGLVRRSRQRPIGAGQRSGLNGTPGLEDSPLCRRSRMSQRLGRS